MGDNLDAVAAGRIQEESHADTDYDPTRPPTPTHDIAARPKPARINRRRPGRARAAYD